MALCFFIIIIIEIFYLKLLKNYKLYLTITIRLFCCILEEELDSLRNNTYIYQVMWLIHTMNKF